MTTAKKTVHVREPLFHLAKRDNMPRHKALLIRLIAIAVGLLIICIFGYAIIQWTPLDILVTLKEGTFDTANRRWALMESTALLLLLSLAVTPAFRMRFWNIGAEGQTLISCLVTGACMLKFGDKVPNPVLILIALVSAVAVGALWALIPAIFKAFWNTNETLFTLMMNYIAAQITSYFVYIWSTPKGSGHVGVINQSTQAGWLTNLAGQDYLLTILIAVVMTFVSYIYLNYCKHGYEISVVGESEKTARYIGINVKTVILRTMIISGAICGLTGFLIVAGADHTFIKDSVGGLGFTAIMVSWLAKFNPIAMAFFSFLIAFLEKGAKEITTQTRLDASFGSIVVGLVIFCIIGCEFFINYSIRFRRKEKAKEAVANVTPSDRAETPGSESDSEEDSENKPEAAEEEAES
ncbi:MAG: ABC transporter permease [Lachnospiraceae bacterium]|nr:ABC transporter permease [Lachnospiraceae bacterium]